MIHFYHFSQHDIAARIQRYDLNAKQFINYIILKQMYFQQNL